MCHTLSVFFIILSSLSLSCFGTFPPPQTQPKVSTLEMAEVKNICKIWELMSNDLNFLKQFRRVCAFLTMALMFSFQLKTLSKTTPRYLYVSTRSTSTPLMTTESGILFFIPSAFLLSFQRSNPDGYGHTTEQSCQSPVGNGYRSYQLSVISVRCRQCICQSYSHRESYRENKNGDKTVPCCVHVLVQMTSDIKFCSVAGGCWWLQDLRSDKLCQIMVGL